MSTRIIIVEDEAIVAAELESRLKLMNYEVCAIADNADEACLLIETLKPQVVLLDIGIRGQRDGLRVGEFLRRRGDTPFVYVTAHDDAVTLGEAGATGPFGYILKPFQNRDLQTSIEMALHRHEAELNYRKLKRWLSTTLESIGDGVIATDRQGRITFINRAAEALTGWNFRACVGRHYSEIFRLSSHQDQELLRERVKKALEEKSTVHCEGVTWLQSRRHGSTIAIEESVAPIRNDEGELDEDSGVVIVFRDSSRRLQLEQERLALERQIQEGQRLDTLGMMASGIAHDFNNLLAMIQGNVSLCQVPGTDDLKPMFSAIEQAVERGAQLCGQMLAYAAKGVSCTATVNLSALTTSLCRQMEVIVPHHITLELQTSNRCSDVAGDSRLLEDVIRGLILNSLEALAERPGTICVTVDSDAAGWVSLTVRDTGPGIREDLQHKVFEPFFTTKFQGRGLGLAAARGVVRNHRGKLELQSEPGSGTTILVQLPSINTPLLESEPVIEPQSPPEPQTPREKLRCLVVDDEPALRELVRRMLDRMGYAVDEAEDGLDAVQQIEKEPSRHDFILMDLTMPKLGGRRALERIRQTRPDIPTILMSGYEAELPDSATLNTPFLHKPFSLQKLTTTVQELKLPK